MKINIICLFIIISFITAQAQITSIAMNIEELKDAPFKFRGARAMMVDRIDDASSKNLFVVSKVISGSYPDTLFVQKFTKMNQDWKLTQEKAITYKGIISIWKSRKAFADADKDKQVDALFIYSLHDAKMEKQLAVNLLLMYKNDNYTISETPDKKISYSANFLNLPKSVKSYVIEYWDKLDKY